MRTLSSARVLALVVLAGCDGHPTAPDIVANTEHRIAVRDVAGHAELYDRVTGESFNPRGFNYTRLPPLIQRNGEPARYHSVLDVGRYAPTAIDAMLDRMQADGYNTVRLFLDVLDTPGALGDPGGGLNDGYITNVIDLLRRAERRGIQVIFTLDNPPETGGYLTPYDAWCCDLFEGSNLQLMTPGGIEADRGFWTQFVTILRDRGAPFGAVLAWEIRNELGFDASARPLSLEAGRVTAANGTTYDLGVTGDRLRLMDESLVFWLDEVRRAIRAVDPTALVTAGFFVPQDPHPTRAGDPRLMRVFPALATSELDFVDLHLYPNGDLTMPELADNFGIGQRGSKPIVMGEFGAPMEVFSSASDGANAVRAWQAESCGFGFTGWLFWTFDTTEQEGFWTATDQDGAIADALSPRVRPDPCAP